MCVVDSDYLQIYDIPANINDVGPGISSHLFANNVQLYIGCQLHMTQRMAQQLQSSCNWTLNIRNIVQTETNHYSVNWRDKGGVDGSMGRGLVECMLELTNWCLEWWMLRWITVLLVGWVVCKMIRWVDGWMIKRKCRWLGDKTDGGWIVLDLFLDNLMDRWWIHS